MFEQKKVAVLQVKKKKVAEIAVGRSFLLAIFSWFGGVFLNILLFRPFAASALPGMSQEVSFAYFKMKIA